MVYKNEICVIEGLLPADVGVASASTGWARMGVVSVAYAVIAISGAAGDMTITVQAATDNAGTDAETINTVTVNQDGVTIVGIADLPDNKPFVSVTVAGSGTAGEVASVVICGVSGRYEPLANYNYSGVVATA